MLPLRPPRKLVLLASGVVLVAMSAYVVDTGTKVLPFSLLTMWGGVFFRCVHGEIAFLDSLAVLGFLLLFTAVYAGIAWVIGWSLAAFGFLVKTLLATKSRQESRTTGGR